MLNRYFVQAVIFVCELDIAGGKPETDRYEIHTGRNKQFLELKTKNKLCFRKRSLFFTVLAWDFIRELLQIHPSTLPILSGAAHNSVLQTEAPLYQVINAMEGFLFPPI